MRAQGWVSAVGLAVCLASAGPATGATLGTPAQLHTTSKSSKPRLRSCVGALVKGIAEGPAHTVSHLKDPKKLTIALASTAGLGLLVKATGINPEWVARPLLLTVLAVRWGQALPRLRLASGAQRWRLVGRELFATTEVGTELLGVHWLGHGNRVVSSSLDAARSFGAWLRAAGQGVLGFHEGFYLRFGDHDHDHGAGDHGGHGHAHVHDHDHEHST
jgi:hypothetical protein